MRRPKKTVRIPSKSKAPARPIRSKQRELDDKRDEIAAEIERLQKEIEEAPKKRAAEAERRQRELISRAMVLDRPIDPRHDEFEYNAPVRPRRRTLKAEARAARQRFFVLLIVAIVIGLAVWGYLRN